MEPITKNKLQELSNKFTPTKEGSIRPPRKDSVGAITVGAITPRRTIRNGAGGEVEQPNSTGTAGIMFGTKEIRALHTLIDGVLKGEIPPTTPLTEPQVLFLRSLKDQIVQSRFEPKVIGELSNAKYEDLLLKIFPKLEEDLAHIIRDSR